MRATGWEFKNRALIFGLLISLSFFLYSFDHGNATTSLSDWLGSKLRWNADILARAVFFAAALLLACAALLRTWASSYLRADVVYASEVKTASLVADGPYRLVRNPLYLANVWMAVALGTMMSRAGFFVMVAATLIFCYRLIMREESELGANQLGANQGEQYRSYLRAVPRLLPSWRVRVPSSGRLPQWIAGFKAESWFWGFAVALLAFAITLNFSVFFGVMAASLVLFWLSASLLEKSRAPKH